MDVHAASCGLETNASSGRGTGSSGPALPLYFSLPVLFVESLCLLNASDDSSCPWATWLLVVWPTPPHHPSLALLAHHMCLVPALFRLSAFAYVVPSAGMPLVCLAISLLDVWRGLPTRACSPPHQPEETLSPSLLFSLYNLSHGSVSICLHV